MKWHHTFSFSCSIGKRISLEPLIVDGEQFKVMMALSIQL
jgi:hypothetical protein